MKIRTTNRNNLRDPRHEAFNYNMIVLPLLVSLMKQLLFGNLNIFSVQIETSSVHIRVLPDMGYILALKKRSRAQASSQTLSNQIINIVFQNGGRLKRFCDFSLGFFQVLHGELQLC